MDNSTNGNPKNYTTNGNPKSKAQPLSPIASFENRSGKPLSKTFSHFFKRSFFKQNDGVSEKTVDDSLVTSRNSEKTDFGNAVSMNSPPSSTDFSTESQQLSPSPPPYFAQFAFRPIGTQEFSSQKFEPVTVTENPWSKIEQGPSFWHRKRQFSSLEAVVSNGYKYYYAHGPRWRPLDFGDQQLLSLFKKRERKLVYQKKQELAVRRLAALEYHRPFISEVFQFPSVVPSHPLDITKGDYIVTIVTTACLPWLTGTSINPLLRAAYLEQNHNLRVTILFPWIPIEQQNAVYTGTVFSSREEQASYVRDWVEKRLNIRTNMRILFYDAWYDARKGSIFPLDRSDVTEYILDEEADVAVLEEPEHLCWYHFVGPKWRIKFNHSVGIAHTNYIEYIKRDLVHGGPMTAKFVGVFNWLVGRANCHLVIRLSAAVQKFADSIVCNVHGVSPQFLVDNQGGETREGCYFIGKVLWGKGYRELCDLLLLHCQKYGFSRKNDSSSSSSPSSFSSSSLDLSSSPSSINGLGSHKVSQVPLENGVTNGVNGASTVNNVEKVTVETRVDVYGSGFDEEEVMTFSSSHNLPMYFHGKKDHADPLLRKYKVFINPSVSDVLCTTTAEALAMGKIVVVADHPSNEFFRDNFPENCRVYDFRNPEAFSSALLRALNSEPMTLRAEQKRLLSWEAATERFMQAAKLS